MVWNDGEAGRLPVGPQARKISQAGNGREEGRGTRRDHDILCRVAHAGHCNCPRARQPPGSAYQSDAVLAQPTLLAGIGVVGDHEIAPGQRGSDIYGRGARGIVGTVRGFSGPQQRLGGNAGPVGAFSAD